MIGLKGNTKHVQAAGLTAHFLWTDLLLAVSSTIVTSLEIHESNLSEGQKIFQKSIKVTQLIGSNSVELRPP
jgi:hypothetical protein